MTKTANSTITLTEEIEEPVTGLTQEEGQYTLVNESSALAEGAYESVRALSSTQATETVELSSSFNTYECMTGIVRKSLSPVLEQTPSPEQENDLQLVEGAYDSFGLSQASSAHSQNLNVFNPSAQADKASRPTTATPGQKGYTYAVVDFSQKTPH